MYVQKKAFHVKKDGSGLNGLHSAFHQGKRALSTPASGSSPERAKVWAQEGAQVASVITMPKGWWERPLPMGLLN